MNVLLFGATGMVGQAVLREALLDPGGTDVLAVGRRATGQLHPKLREHLTPDVTDLTPLLSELPRFDACLFCLGVSSVGMDEARYTALTYDLTLRIARTLAQHAPEMDFLYVSGRGTDATEQGRVMWARVKGRTENALRALPFRGAYMIRLAALLPRPGITSGTPWVRRLVALTRLLHGLLLRLFPDQVITSDELGRALLTVARDGYPAPVLESPDLVRLGRRA